MTTVKTTRDRGGFRLPDPPPRVPDDMTSFNHLTRTSAVYLLAQHLEVRTKTPVVKIDYAGEVRVVRV